MVNSEDFAKRLHQILDYYQLSATALADKLEVNRSTISHLLSGRNKPSLDFVMKLLSHFPEVDLYWLMNGSGQFPKTQDTFQPHPQGDDFRIKKISDQDETGSFPSFRSKDDREIERIVIFFKDGSFTAYEGA